MEVIDKIKTLLGLKDNDQDNLLNVIIENTEQALCFKLSAYTCEYSKLNEP